MSDNYNTYIDQLCPNCGYKALVEFIDFDTKEIDSDCLLCGYYYKHVIRKLDIRFREEGDTTIYWDNDKGQALAVCNFGTKSGLIYSEEELLDLLTFEEIIPDDKYIVSYKDGHFQLRYGTMPTWMVDILKDPPERIEKADVQNFPQETSNSELDDESEII